MNVQPSSVGIPEGCGHLSRLGSGEKNLSRRSGTKVAKRPSERARASQLAGDNIPGICTTIISRPGGALEKNAQSSLNHLLKQPDSILPNTNQAYSSLFRKIFFIAFPKPSMLIPSYFLAIFIRKVAFMGFHIDDKIESLTVTPAGVLVSAYISQ